MVDTSSKPEGAPRLTPPHPAAFSRLMRGRARSVSAAASSSATGSALRSRSVSASCKAANRCANRPCGACLPPHLGDGALDFLLHLSNAFIDQARDRRRLLLLGPFSLCSEAPAPLPVWPRPPFANSSSDFAAALRALWARFLPTPASASVGRASFLGGFFDNPPFLGRPLPAVPAFNPTVFFCSCIIWPMRRSAIMRIASASSFSCRLFACSAYAAKAMAFLRISVTWSMVSACAICCLACVKIRPGRLLPFWLPEYWF